MIWIGLVVVHSGAFAWPRLFPSGAGAAASAVDAADDEDEVSVRLRPVVVHNVCPRHTHTEEKEYGVDIVEPRSPVLYCCYPSSIFPLSLTSSSFDHQIILRSCG